MTTADNARSLAATLSRLAEENRRDLAEAERDTRGANALADRYAALVRKARRQGVTLTLVTAPIPDALDRFTMIGDPTDLVGQLDVAEAYIIGLAWRDVPRG